jgi:hypothetical protein
MKRLYLINPVFYYSDTIEVAANNLAEAMEKAKNFVISGAYDNEDQELSFIGLAETGHWNIIQKKDYVKTFVELGLHKEYISRQ